MDEPIDVRGLSRDDYQTAKASSIADARKAQGAARSTAPEAAKTAADVRDMEPTVYAHWKATYLKSIRR